MEIVIIEMGRKKTANDWRTFCRGGPTLFVNIHTIRYTELDVWKIMSI